MFNRVAIDESDRRNVIIVVMVMFGVMLVLVEGPIAVRVVVAAILGLGSGLCSLFLIVTLNLLTG
ncbi:MAG: hypothetical protein J07HX64_01180 [halophilic archaeon J07HX64]|jgi:hypothetical protein|nr:MAG: hypothetical protein J07HX64_01180 [halophilic archaeon J07HX64]